MIEKHKLKNQINFYEILQIIQMASFLINSRCLVV
jgi:hypothetical protein